MDKNDLFFIIKNFNIKFIIKKLKSYIKAKKNKKIKKFLKKA